MENELKVHYGMIRRWHHHPLLGKIPSYRIFGRDNFGKSRCFKNPIYDKGLALRLIMILNRNGVSLLHTEDVLHDLLTEIYAL